MRLLFPAIAALSAFPHFLSPLFPFLADYEFVSLDGGNCSYARIECRHFCPVPTGELRQIEIGYLLMAAQFLEIFLL